jgi:hypothetical protein
MRTHPEPDHVVHLTRSFDSRNLTEIVDQFQTWQKLIADPKLDRRFGTEFWLTAGGAEIKATFYGSKDESISSGIIKMMPKGELIEDNWTNTYKWQTDNMEMYKSDLPAEFYSRSLGFTAQDLFSRAAIEEIFRNIHEEGAKSGAWKWFVIFDATGGQVSDIAMNATSYAHRDKVMFYQSYALNIMMNDKALSFINKTHQRILSHLPKGIHHTTYPGYVDPALVNPQQAYWSSNLPRLEQIKAKWDPSDIFHNPQSVRPGSESDSR